MLKKLYSMPDKKINMWKFISSLICHNKISHNYYYIYINNCWIWYTRPITNIGILIILSKSSNELMKEIQVCYFSDIILTGGSRTKKHLKLAPRAWNQNLSEIGDDSLKSSADLAKNVPYKISIFFVTETKFDVKSVYHIRIYRASEKALK